MSRPARLKSRRKVLALAGRVSVTWGVSGLGYPTSVMAQGARTDGPSAAGYIVVLNGAVPAGQDASQHTRSVAIELLARHGGTLDRVFGSALYGFSARLTAAQRDAMSADPRVKFVEPDSEVRTQPSR